MAIGEQRLSHRMLAPLLRPAGRGPRPAGDQLAATQPAASQLAAPPPSPPRLEALLQEKARIDRKLRLLAQDTVGPGPAGRPLPGTPAHSPVRLQGHGLSKPDHARAVLGLNYKAFCHEGQAWNVLRHMDSDMARGSSGPVATARLCLLASDIRRSMLALALHDKHRRLAAQAKAARVAPPPGCWPAVQQCRGAAPEPAGRRMATTMLTTVP